MDLHLRDHIAIVTGANGGIGTAICQELLQEGVVVVPFYRGHEDKLAPLRQGMVERDICEDRLFPVCAELTDLDALTKGVAQVEARFGRVDILVNNAGYAIERPFLILEPEEATRIWDINFRAPTQLMQCVLKPMMRAKKGAVVNITSLVGEAFGRGVAMYAASKAALNRFTQILAMEMSKKGIRINAVAPGLIETSMSQSLADRMAKMQNPSVPTIRAGRPEEVAKAVVFLASDVAASYITGQVLTVDGGMGL